MVPVCRLIVTGGGARNDRLRRLAGSPPFLGLERIEPHSPAARRFDGDKSPPSGSKTVRGPPSKARPPLVSLEGEPPLRRAVLTATTGPPPMPEGPKGAPEGPEGDEPKKGGEPPVGLPRLSPFGLVVSLRSTLA